MDPVELLWAAVIGVVSLALLFRWRSIAVALYSLIYSRRPGRAELRTHDLFRLWAHQDRVDRIGCDSVAFSAQGLAISIDNAQGSSSASFRFTVPANPPVDLIISSEGDGEHREDDTVASVLRASSFSATCLEPMTRWQVAVDDSLATVVAPSSTPPSCEERACLLKESQQARVSARLRWVAYGDAVIVERDASRQHRLRMDVAQTEQVLQWGHLLGTVTVNGFVYTVKARSLRQRLRRPTVDAHSLLTTLGLYLDNHLGVALLSQPSSGSMPSWLRPTAADRTAFVWRPSGLPHLASVSDYASRADLGVCIDGDLLVSATLTGNTNQSPFTAVSVLVHRGQGPSLGGAGVLLKHPSSVSSSTRPVASSLSSPCLVAPFGDNDASDLSQVGSKCQQLSLLTAHLRTRTRNTKQKSTDDDDASFSIPDGFCITFAAHELHLSESEAGQRILKLLLHLHDPISGAVREDTAAELAHVYESAAMHVPVAQAIRDAYVALAKRSGAASTSPMVAVRSSAASEDTQDSSSAGQNETFLGVCGVEEVTRAVMRCWASVFSVRATNYRAQRGLDAAATEDATSGAVETPRIGVAVQLLVSSRVAGVLFTADPLRNDRSRIVLTANYGLGESVVDGSVDPDTFVVARDDATFDIVQRSLGTKQMRVDAIKHTPTATDSTSSDTTRRRSTRLQQGESAAPAPLVDVTAWTSRHRVSADDARKFCLTDKEVLRLARAAVHIEHIFGSARDIEFALLDSVLYVLQARPITSLEADERVMHEFDTPGSWPREYNTTCNIGEMLPGAISPLSMSTVFRSVDLAITHLSHHCGAIDYVPAAPKSLQFHYNQGFICLHAVNLISAAVATTTTELKQRIDVSALSICGRVMPEELSVESVIEYLGRKSLPKRLACSMRFLRLLAWDVNQRRDATIALQEKYRREGDPIHFEEDEVDDGDEVAVARRQFDAIDKHLPEQVEAWTVHTMVSAKSAVWPTVLLQVLSQGKAWTSTHYADMAALLADCGNVISAGVPTAMDRLADLIIELTRSQPRAGHVLFEDDPDVDGALEWLRTRAPEPIRAAFEQFLVNYGHRCIRESELREAPWAAAPEKLVPSLQSIVRTRRSNDGGSGSTSAPSIDEVLDKLMSPMTTVGKAVLRRIVPWARAAVAQRELGKSLACWSVSRFRIAYRQLAACLVKQQLLPDADAIFFLTHREVGQLVHARGHALRASLLAQAVHRRRILAVQATLRFPAVSAGVPIPYDDRNNKEGGAASDTSKNDSSDRLVLSGFPVSRGIVRGPCRVVCRLEDTSAILPGDIMICEYTDIGWTPLFAVIAGIATDLGGLLSHGAVVAREYGIPCVVRLGDATRRIQSGVMVELNGDTGTLTVLE